jgi:hypothetical protein
MPEHYFRFYDESAKKMIYIHGDIYIIFFNNPKKIKWGIYDCKANVRLYSSQYGDDKHLMQGFLHDGKIVYDKDIVWCPDRIKNKYQSVEYKFGCFMIEKKPFYIWAMDNDFIVQGNTYKDSKLLKNDSN